MTEQSREPDPRSLAAYLSGEASPSESAEVLRWAQSSATAMAHLRRLEAVWQASRRPTDAASESPWTADDIWKSIAPRLDDEDTPRLRLITPARMAGVVSREASRGRRAAMWLSVAACIVVAVGVWAQHRGLTSRAASSPAPPVAVREYRTERGQRASVTLPDGSALQLGPLSVLRVGADYGTPSRTVELEGDGYFNVTHDVRHPFSVKTGRTTIRDVGTRFIVRARADESRVEIAVADGEVAVETLPAASATASGPGMLTSGPLHVAARHVALVDERGLATLLPRASVAARFAWTRGELAFDHVPVPIVLAELSRWYGNSFVLADKQLQPVRLTTVIRGETLLEALVVLETALEVDTRVSGDTVTLLPRRGGRAR